MTYKKVLGGSWGKSTKDLIFRWLIMHRYKLKANTGVSSVPHRSAFYLVPTGLPNFIQRMEGEKSTSKLRGSWMRWRNVKISVMSDDIQWSWSLWESLEGLINSQRKKLNIELVKRYRKMWTNDEFSRFLNHVILLKIMCVFFFF